MALDLIRGEQYLDAMDPVRQISRRFGYAARQYAVLTPLLGLGIPAACLVLLAAFGWAASSLFGASAWEPASSFVDRMAVSVTAMPGLIGITGLAMVAIVLPLVAAFGYWCLSQETARPAAFRLRELVRRLAALASSLWISRSPASQPSAAAPGALPRLYSHTPPSSSPADLSGAVPQLE